MRELLVARRRRVRELWVQEGTAASALLDEILRLARGSGIPVREVTGERIAARAVTDAPQGVLAAAEPLVPVDFRDLCAPSDGRPALLVVAEGLTDPRNLGALLRSAAFAGATGVVLPGRRAAHVTPAVAKASAGAIEHIPVAVVAGVPSALSDFARRGVWTVGLDAGAEGSLYDLPLSGQPLALVVGAEGAGLRSLTARRCDVLARIPGSGAISSLNVGVAAAVACCEIARRRSLA